MSVLSVKFDGHELRVRERVKGYDLEPMVRLGKVIGHHPREAEIEVETVTTDPDVILGVFANVAVRARARR